MKNGMLDAIIVGAGFAGLSAARALKARGVEDFAVLEARDRVGGRTKHGTLKGLDIDLGGMWVGPTQERLKDLGEQYQIGTYPTFIDGDTVYRIQGKEAHGSDDNFGGILSLYDTTCYILIRRKMDKLMERLDCERPWDHEEAERLDAMTVEQWLRTEVKSQRLREFLRVLCAALFCGEPSQISMLFFLHYIKSGDGLDVLLSSDSGGAQNFLFHGGVHQIARKMGEEIGDRLHLEAPAQEIEWSDEGVTVRASGNEWKARRVIIAVPPTLVPRIRFSPALPHQKMTLHQRLNMGSVIKYWVVYERPFWRDQGFNGVILRDDIPCSPNFDATPPGHKHGVMAGFFDGDRALSHGDMTMEERRAIVLNMLAEHYGDAALSPLDYVDNDWVAEEWSGGCYGAFAPPGVYSRYGAWLREPIGALHWAGTETSPRWTGYIDGAIRSGERAAEEIV